MMNNQQQGNQMNTNNKSIALNNGMEIEYVSSFHSRFRWDVNDVLGVSFYDLYKVSTPKWPTCFVKRLVRCEKPDEGQELCSHKVLSMIDYGVLRRRRETELVWSQREIVWESEWHNIQLAVICFLNTKHDDYRYAIFHPELGEQKEVACRPWK